MHLRVYGCIYIYIQTNTYPIQLQTLIVINVQILRILIKPNGCQKLDYYVRVYYTEGKM